MILRRPVFFGTSSDATAVERYRQVTAGENEKTVMAEPEVPQVA
jgi:hypothetical protein